MKANEFYSHVICSGTKIAKGNTIYRIKFYSHVICSGTKMLQRNPTS